MVVGRKPTIAAPDSVGPWILVYLGQSLLIYVGSVQVPCTILMLAYRIAETYILQATTRTLVGMWIARRIVGRALGK